MRWELLTGAGATPVERSSHSITYIAGTRKLVLFGGEHDPRTPINSDVHLYDLDGGVWTVASSSSKDVPEPRVAHTAVAVMDKEIMLFGGRSGKAMGENAYNDLHVFGMETCAWRRIDDAKGAVPAARSYHTATATGDCMFVFGGCGAEGRLADLHRFDFKVSEKQTRSLILYSS